MATDPARERTAVLAGFNQNLPFWTPTVIDVVLNQSIARCALLGHDISQLEAISTLLTSRAPHCQIMIYQVDIRSTESWGQAAHEIRSRLGAWDLFVHDPDGFASDPSPCTSIRGADDDEWWAVFERNVRSLQFVARHFLPKMKAGARLVTISRASKAGEMTERSSALTASASAGAIVLGYLEKENAASGLKVMTVNDNDTSSQLSIKILQALEDI